MAQSKQPMTEAAKKFFASKSKLSSGESNKRFGGQKFHQTHLQAVTFTGSRLRD